MNHEATDLKQTEHLATPRACREDVLHPASKPVSRSKSSIQPALHPLASPAFHRAMSAAAAMSDPVSAMLNGPSGDRARGSALEFMDDPLNGSVGDPLWDLLGKARLARPVEVSPFFARNVLRAIRQQEAKGGWAGKLQTAFQTLLQAVRPAVPGYAMAACLALVMGLVAATSAVLTTTNKDARLALRAGDAEIVSNLDILLPKDGATDGSNVWLDTKPTNPTF